MLKKISLLLTGLMLVVVLVACGNNTNSAVEAYLDEHGSGIVNDFSGMGGLNNDITLIAGEGYYFTMIIDVIIDEELIEGVEALEEDEDDVFVDLLEEELDRLMVHFILLANAARDELEVDEFRVYVEYSFSQSTVSRYFDSHE